MPYACSYYRLRPDSYGGYEFLFPFKDEILAEKISKLLKVTHFSGIFDIEFLIGEDDELYFMKINFRNSGCSYACTDGGFNLPFRWAVSTLQNKLYLDGFKPILKFDAMNEIGDYYDSVKTKKVSIFNWIKELKGCKSYYLYNAKDPAPFRNFIFQKIKKKLC